ncbi:MAG TPA: tRNA-uridine aminocarboxypropyltransferase [Anaeromyxobacteraceae bacterium]|nr:tRNA-uridine aminocarboxypropyltransferase [Anaeromyxobacteraceae bacterium]
MTAVPLRTLPPGRCARCAFPRELCLCDEVPRLEVPIQFVILRHASEIPRLTSTARWAALALPGAEIVDYALPGAPLDGAALPTEGAWALFPSARPTAAGSASPRRIVVPDGTWQQARRMMHRVPALQRLPRLSLPAAPPAPRLRRPPVPGGMSTMEAIAEALRFLGHGDEAERLLALNALAVERAARLRGIPAALT